MAREQATSSDAPMRVPSRSRVLRALLWSAGVILVGVGTLGVFLPLLPATPFFLLAAACFGRSSPRAYVWLTTNRWFGQHLRNYQEHRGATAQAKLFSVATLWIGIGGSAFLLRDRPWLSGVLVAIAVAVTFYLVVRLRTVER